MERLAKAGYIGGRMATMQFPQGIEIEGSTQDCLGLTAQQLQEEEVVLFEPAFFQRGFKMLLIL